MAECGPCVLKDCELLAIILGSGTKGENVLEVSGRLLRKHKIDTLSGMGIEDLEKIQGIGRVKACQLVACFEIARRATSKQDKPAIRSAEDVFKVMHDLQHLKTEHFVRIYLNTKNQIIHKEVIAKGGLNVNMTHPREIFRPALANSAAAVVLVHNHPSGDPAPSDNDIELSKRLVKAGQLIGI